MPIYLDPTETSSSTRMPQSVIRQAQVLTGLEAVTGADFLITTHKIKLPSRGLQCGREAVEVIASYDPEFHTQDQIAEIVGVPFPDVAIVQGVIQAIRVGVLAQRKSGMDFISSIPNLRDIRNRMLRWTWRSWLLPTGKFDVANGHVVVDGHESNYSPRSVQGAIRAWRFDGGQVDVLDSDKEIATWISDTLNTLRVMEAKQGDDGRMRRYKRDIPARDDDRARALAILATLKGVGESGAKKLLDYYGNLAAVLEACLDPSIPKSKYRPGGVLGKVTVGANRKLFGFDENLDLDGWKADELSMYVVPHVFKGE